jgi:uncharacterized protein
MNEMNGKWALVTGASSGFGVDFATLLPERNANLMLAARGTEMFLALWVQLWGALGTPHFNIHVVRGK